MELVDVVNKLVGPISPVGESYEDERRLANIKVMGELVHEMICDIHDASTYHDCYMHSRMVIGKEARRILNNLKDYIE